MFAPSEAGEKARAERWVGVDEAVVERFAREAGVAPKGPLLPVDQGDMLLFLFLSAGLLAGFVVGYCARMLFAENYAKPAADNYAKRSAENYAAEES